MTPAEQRLARLLAQRTARLQPDLARAWVKAVEILRRTMDPARIEALLATGRVEDLVQAILSDETLDRAFLPVKTALHETTAAGFRLSVAGLPGHGLIDGVPAVGFDVVSPRVIDALRVLEAQILAPAKAAVRETVRQAVLAGVAQGTNPRQIAREVRAVVGLAPHQELAVRNFTQALRDGDTVKALGYQLRDKRYDGTVRKGALSEAQIEKMSAAYRKRFEAHHAETVARTATLNAYRTGQHTAYESAIERGIIDRGRAMKTWVNVGDDRVRDAHLNQSHGGIAGETVPFDSPFSNGLMYPQEYQCRCFLRYTQAKPATFPA